MVWRYMQEYRRRIIVADTHYIRIVDTFQDDDPLTTILLKRIELQCALVQYVVCYDKYSK